MPSTLLFLAGFVEILEQAITTVLEHYLVLIIAAVLLLVVAFFKERFMSWINTLFGKIPVQGRWETVLFRGAVPEAHEVAHLHQFLNRVWGETTTKELKPKMVYKVRGRICGEKLCLILRAERGRLRHRRDTP